MNHLPFNCCSNIEFDALFCQSDSADKFSDLIKDHNFRDIIYKSTKNELFNTLDCGYYTSDKFNSKFRRMNKSIEISIFHLNIRSLNSKIREFLTLIHLLDIDFDIIVHSEIWFYNLDFYKNIFKDYCFYFDKPVLGNIRGVGISVKNLLCPKLCININLPNNANQKCESLLLEVCKEKSKYIVGGIYRHPNQNIEHFTNMFETILNKISKYKVPIFLAADLNINFLKCDQDVNTSAFIIWCIMHNCLPLILLPTRATSKSATLIDHILYYEGCNNKKRSQSIQW